MWMKVDQLCERRSLRVVLTSYMGLRRDCRKFPNTGRELRLLEEAHWLQPEYFLGKKRSIFFSSHNFDILRVEQPWIWSLCDVQSEHSIAAPREHLVLSWGLGRPASCPNSRVRKNMWVAFIETFFFRTSKFRWASLHHPADTVGGIQI